MLAGCCKLVKKMLSKTHNLCVCVFWFSKQNKTKQQWWDIHFKASTYYCWLCVKHKRQCPTLGVITSSKIMNLARLSKAKKSVESDFSLLPTNFPNELHLIQLVRSETTGHRTEIKHDKYFRCTDNWVTEFWIVQKINVGKT